jgi:hypothetical protein
MTRMSALPALWSVQCTRRSLASPPKLTLVLILWLICLHPIASRAQNPAGNALTRSSVPPAFHTTGAVPVITEQAKQIEQGLEERLRTLANVICSEETERYARKGKSTSQVDTLHLNVEVLGGVERYSEIRRNDKIYADMRKVPGTWSTGEMATLLSATRDAIEAGQIRIARDETSDLGPSSVMTFSYTAEERRWYLMTHSQVHWLPFEGRLWASPDTGEIRRITWLTKDVPDDTGVSQVLWTVNFSPVDLEPVVVTLPETVLYQVTYKNSADHMDWNVTRFSGYRRYGSETAVHFDD